MLIILIVVLLLVGLGGGGYYYRNRWGRPTPGPPPPEGPPLPSRPWVFSDQGGLIGIVLLIILLVWLFGSGRF